MKLLSKFYEEQDKIIICSVIIVFILIGIYNHYKKPDPDINGSLFSSIKGIELIMKENDREWIERKVNIHISPEKTYLYLSAIAGTPGDYHVLKESIHSSFDLNCRTRTLRKAIYYANNLEIKKNKNTLMLATPKDCNWMNGFEKISVWIGQPEVKNLIGVYMRYERDGSVSTPIYFTINKIKKFITLLSKAEDGAINFRNKVEALDKKSKPPFSSYNDTGSVFDLPGVFYESDIEQVPKFNEIN